MTLVDELSLVALLAGLLTTVGLLPLLIRFAPHLRLMVHPNERSSHLRPTPTGGGVAIAVPVLVWCALAPTDSPGLQLAIAGGVLALTGFLDDIFDLPALLRFTIQIFCVAGFFHATGGASSLPVFVATVFAVLWFVNLFNFMDGIDGIAASQAAIYGVGVLLLSGATLNWHESLIWLMVASCSGFLLFNWRPAMVFMGDAGSLLLGLTIAVIALELDRSGEVPLVASLILLAVFVFDATYTLVVRLITGQRFTAAHRSHLYQRLALRYGHGQATIGFVLYSGLWLVPLAMCAAKEPSRGPWLCAFAVFPLLMLALRFRAGQLDAKEARQAVAELPSGTPPEGDTAGEAAGEAAGKAAGKPAGKVEGRTEGRTEKKG